tara:strand:+ start:1474 stop:2097 length:624 start_codon:yes stop_codon:yes gene_type:complete
MKKTIILTLVFNYLFFFQNSILAGELKVTVGSSNKISNYKKAYFAGGCFWCMEETFDQFDGIVKSISGYSGGDLKNPTYEEVIYKDTGHVETIQITYDPKKITYKKLLEIYWKNIDPFDKYGQFCDKGKSYRSVVFFQNKIQKRLIEKSILDIEKKFNAKVVTLMWEFDKFYKAEDYHQDYYQRNFLRYLAYKKACQREEVLKKIWN